MVIAQPRESSWCDLGRYVEISGAVSVVPVDMRSAIRHLLEVVIDVVMDVIRSQTTEQKISFL